MTSTARYVDTDDLPGEAVFTMQDYPHSKFWNRLERVRCNRRPQWFMRGLDRARLIGVVFTFRSRPVWDP